MNTTASITARRPLNWPLAVVLAVAALGIVWFLGKKIHYYVDFSADSYTEYFWPRRVGLIPHIFGGLLAISAGLVQIWLGLTNRTGKLHHALGKVYGAGVVVGSLGGYYIALTIPAGYMVYQVGLFMLCTAWVLTTSMALWSIRQRRINQHRDWMLRSYIVTFAFVIYRIGAQWLHTWLNMPSAEVADEIDNLMAWACWAVPLLIAEPLIQLRAVRRMA
ncbi:MAG: DUF2306 domain-containing protein [Pseudomonadota bacterium]